MALRTRPTGLYLPMRVWDVPTRLFHWLIVVIVPAAYATAKLGWTDCHLWLGYGLLALLLFRIAWGFVGSDTSRFDRFLASPRAVLRHLAQFGRRGPDIQIGHDAACGWMALLLLLLLAIEVGSGLGAGAGGAEGPLARYVSGRTRDLLTVVHGMNMNLILAAVGVHIAAIALYAAVRRQNLVRPMITGKKRLPAATRAPRMAGTLLAAVVFVLAAAVALLLATEV